ncbi:MAG: DUF4173 domain-containing protein [Clostridia bacterium]|nr:DUF4173 domain-containing protein [Clostridia bacterium]
MRKRAAGFVYAIILTVAVYLIWTSIFHENTLLFWITSASLFAATLILGLLCGARPGFVTIFSLVSGVIFSVYAWINGLFFETAYVYAHAILIAYAFFALSLFGNHNKRLRTGTFILDAIKAIFVYPFFSFAAYFLSLFHWKTRSKKVGMAVLYAVIGIAAALVLGLIAISLLSYDPRFEALIKIDFTLEDVPEAILKLMISIPVAALLFSVFCSSKERKLDGFSTQEKADSIGARIKRIPAIVFLIPSLTLLIIYGLFFFSQWTFYMGAFSSMLPDEYTAAEYARNGFFELCAVAALNALLCTSFTIFAKVSGNALNVAKKAANTLLALATLILIATAFSKLALYIERFDLTYTRFFVAVLLFLFTVGFITLILSQWIRRVQVLPVLTVCVAAMLLIAPFCNARGRIAAYNVDRYLERAQQNEPDNRIDTEYLIYELGDAAIPEAIRLLESDKLDPADAANLRHLLESKYSALKELESARLTLAGNKALQAFRSFFEHN